MNLELSRYELKKFFFSFKSDQQYICHKLLDICYPNGLSLKPISCLLGQSRVKIAISLLFKEQLTQGPIIHCQRKETQPFVRGWRFKNRKEPCSIDSNGLTKRTVAVCSETLSTTTLSTTVVSIPTTIYPTKNTTFINHDNKY